MTVPRLSIAALSRNKRAVATTIAAMSITGIFLVVISTILACADPVEYTEYNFLGEYAVMPVVEDGDQERPELSWKNVIRNNPLDDDLRKKLEAIPGVERVESFCEVQISSNEGSFSICGIPEKYASAMEDSIIEGKISYEEMRSGEKVILSDLYQHWYPQLKIGSKIRYTVSDGEDTQEKEMEIAAVMDYAPWLTGCYMDIPAGIIMPEETARKLSENNTDYHFQIFGTEQYDPEVYQEIREAAQEAGETEVISRQEIYENWKGTLALTNAACYVFLGILGIICIMNMINSLVNSVNVRRREIGLIQAAGMTHRQLGQMLRGESFFYTGSVLAVSVILGSILGYPAFLYAKERKMLDIHIYHYPWMMVLILALVLFIVHLALSWILVRSVEKETLVERIRVGE